MYKRRCTRFLNAIKNLNTCFVYTIKNVEVQVNFNVEVQDQNIIELHIINKTSYQIYSNLHILNRN